MYMGKKTEIRLLNALITVSPSKYKHEMKQVVELFKDRQILTVQTARKTIGLLASKNKKTNIRGLELLAKYEETETATRRLTKNNTPQKYYVKGSIDVINKYSSNRKGQMTDYGKIYHNSIPKTYEIEARSKAEAKRKISTLSNG
jgi:hypothetical protein